MSAETPATSPATSPAKPTHPQSPDAHSIDPSKPLLHRVCIQCNSMFCVTADHYDAKQCPNCHKG